jgi:ketosteroid isomerase-like protein
VFTIRRLEVFENGTAIVAGEGTIKGKDKDGSYVLTYQSSNVLIKRSGLWKAIASHVSGIKRVPQV